MRQRLAEFQAAAATHRAGGEELTGVQGLFDGRVGDDVGETVQHVGAGSAATLLAVDADGHGQGAGVRHLVGGDQPGTHDVAGVEVLALGWPQHGGHFAVLLVAGADVVEDAVAEDVGLGVLRGDVLSRAPQEHAEFQLIVEPVAVARTHDVHPGANHTEAIGLVVDRDVAEHRGQHARHARGRLAQHEVLVCAGLEQVLFEGQAVVHLLGHGHGRQEARAAQRSDHERSRHKGASLLQRRLAAVDQRQHVFEVTGGAGGGEVRHRGFPGQYRAYVGAVLGREGDELHRAISFIAAGVLTPVMA